MKLDSERIRVQKIVPENYLECNSVSQGNGKYKKRLKIVDIRSLPLNILAMSSFLDTHIKLI